MGAQQGFVSQAAMVATLEMGNLATSMGATGMLSGAAGAGSVGGGAAATGAGAGAGAGGGDRGEGGIVPLAQALDVRKRRQLRQRALYAVMFHNSQDELINNIKAHVISADVYLAGASDVIQPYPKVAAST